ncbi:MFS transporter [Pseudovibrio exalbescens]|uniref:MFS transporter permease n=1 Tax=Pseudovibrio exalbescens TaxID=197461 RepID=A0A1U7JDR6_9HYPH|nr:MFS transporter [Pseudovibrio exalbescens]OKL42838.1 MFS transporter permease [Pseudovibrio exalbescens]
MHVATANTGVLFDSRQRRGIIAAIGAITAVGLSLSASLPLLALTLSYKGIPEGMIGLNTAFAGVAAIMATPLCAPLARRFGTPQALLGAVIVSGLSLPLFFFAEQFWMWFPLRILFHGSTCVAFVLSEFWINALAPQARRGMIMGIYATVLSAGLASGPIMLALVGTTGPTPFFLAGALILVATLPIAYGYNAQPDMEEKSSGGFLSFLWIAPMATLAGFVFGAVESSALSLLPLYGLGIGFPAATAALLVTAMTAGSLLLQIPLGMLADRLDRRLILLGCAAIGSIGALLMVPASETGYTVFALLFVWGGIITGLYTIGLTHLGARFSGADLASANAAFVLMYSVGLIVGPALSGFAMKSLDKHGLPLLFAALLGAYLVICLIRTICLRLR